MNIFFDLGAVIIPINFNKTFQSFSTLSGIPVATIGTMYQLHQTDIFQPFEKGHSGNALFIYQVRELLNLPNSISDIQIVKAWNDLLLPIPPERIERIKELRKKHSLYLLSNTNPIHITEVHRILFRSTGVPQLEELFDQTFYSYDINALKPTEDFYQYVLKNIDAKPKDCYFMDDNSDNINGSKKCGIESDLITQNFTMMEATNKYL
ncbi:MAG: HAD family phosphatase [Cytophagaceae bacterium]